MPSKRPRAARLSCTSSMTEVPKAPWRRPSGKLQCVRATARAKMPAPNSIPKRTVSGRATRRTGRTTTRSSKRSSRVARINASRPRTALRWAPRSMAVAFVLPPGSGAINGRQPRVSSPRIRVRACWTVPSPPFSTSTSAPSCSNSRRAWGTDPSSWVLRCRISGCRSRKAWTSPAREWRFPAFALLMTPMRGLTATTPRTARS